jgi:hypothetical protein
LKPSTKALLTRPTWVIVLVVVLGVGLFVFAAGVITTVSVVVPKVQEQHRNRPWFRLPRFPHQTIWRRDLHGILRFPVVRLLRMAALTAIAAGCLNIAYHDTAPAAVLAGLALYLVGLDAVEPLAQEIDQADRADSIPRSAVSSSSATCRRRRCCCSCMRSSAVRSRTPSTARARSPSSPSSRCRRCGRPGAGGHQRGQAPLLNPGPSDTNQMLPPEVAGMRIMFRTVWPVVVCILGTVPVLGARSAESRRLAPLAGAIQGSMAVAVVVGLTAAWLRFREPAKVWWRSMLRESQQEQARRSAARGAR